MLFIQIEKKKNLRVNQHLKKVNMNGKRSVNTKTRENAKKGKHVDSGTQSRPVDTSVSMALVPPSKVANSGIPVVFVLNIKAKESVSAVKVVDSDIPGSPNSPLF